MTQIVHNHFLTPSSGLTEEELALFPESASSTSQYGSGLEGDFIGFTFNGEHSSNMGITRVSNGSRFNDIILPNFSDRTGSVAGMDGMYYFGSQYGQKPIQIQIAFDHLTDLGYRHLRQVFGDKTPHWLIFDETPYKKYMAKIAQPIQLTTICFVENNERIYKGEGQIQFVAYYPFARSVSKHLDDYNDSTEWAATSGLKTATELTSYDTFSDSKFLIYNPGDFEADFKLYIPFTNSAIAAGNLFVTAARTTEETYEKQVQFDEITQASADTQATGICFNSALELIEGAYIENNVIYSTGVVYNKYITAGQLFKLPIVTSLGTDMALWLIATDSGSFATPTLQYDYLYY